MLLSVCVHACSVSARLPRQVLLPVHAQARPCQQYPGRRTFPDVAVQHHLLMPARAPATTSDVVCTTPTSNSDLFKSLIFSPLDPRRPPTGTCAKKYSDDEISYFHLCVVCSCDSCTIDCLCGHEHSAIFWAWTYCVQVAGAVAKLTVFRRCPQLRHQPSPAIVCASPVPPPPHLYPCRWSLCFLRHLRAESVAICGVR